VTGPRSVTLVCGPPCAGKTTWAREQAGEDAWVVDWDDFARRSGSTARWNHSQSVRDEAEARMQDAIASVAAADEGEFYVIRCVPNRSRREALAEYLRADRVAVLLPSIDTLMVRAAERSNAHKAQRGIREWLRDYSPSPIDETAHSSPGTAASSRASRPSSAAQHRMGVRDRPRRLPDPRPPLPRRPEPRRHHRHRLGPGRTRGRPHRRVPLPGRVPRRRPQGPRPRHPLRPVVPDGRRHRPPPPIPGHRRERERSPQCRRR
jgi:predicted kinase